MPAPVVNLNADLGESFGTWRKGDDAALMPLIGAANIACGAHAGDPTVMADSVRLAIEAGAGIGAHPGYNDIWGFGRRPMPMRPRDLELLVAYQIGALVAIAAMQGARVTHVKPHGALHNVAIVEREVADACARGVRGVDRNLILIGLAGSELEAAGRAAGLPFAVEGYADRAYEDDGNIRNRRLEGAMITDPEAARDQVLAMVLENVIVTRSGKRLPVALHSICIHGDEPGAVATATAVRDGLLAAGVRLATLPEMTL